MYAQAGAADWELGHMPDDTLPCQPELDLGDSPQLELCLDGGPDSVRRLVEERPSRFPPYTTRDPQE